MRLRLGILAVVLSSSATAAAQGDWDRAEDDAVGDQTDDVTQAEVLLAPPEEEERREPTRDREEEEASEDPAAEEPTDPGTDDFELFGHTERGGAIGFFGDVGTFFGAVTVLGGAGAVGQTDAFSLSPWFGVSYGITDKLELGAEWGFSILAHGDVRLITGTPEPGGVTVTPGNPTIFARWIPFGTDDDFSWGVDLSVGLPVAGVGSPAERVTIDSAIGSRGAWDLFHWTEGALSIVPGLFLDWEALEGFLLHGEVDLGLLFGVGTPRYSTVGVLQVAVDASYRFAEAMGLGIRLTGVLMGEDVSPTRDTFQLAMAPYVAFFADPLFLRGEFLLNITEPYGTSFRNERWWGARLVVGVDLPG